jgi:hypothetical protein
MRALCILTMFYLVVMSFLSGCASSYTPRLDPAYAIDPDSYSRNLNECKGIAEGVNDAADAAVAGTIGAAGGAVVAKIADNGDEGPVAAITGLLSAATGAADAEQRKISIIQRCLANRGYRVLE